MQSLWLIIVVFFLLLLIVPIFTRVYISFDLIENVGAISLYIFFIKILVYKIRVGKGGLILYTNDKEKDLPIEISKSKMRMIEQFIIQLKQKIVVRRLDVYSNIGTADASSSAIMSGLVSSIVGVCFSLIKNTKKSARLKHINNVSYNEKKFIISVVGRMFITIFDVIYSLFVSLIIVKRSEKYERI